MAFDLATAKPVSGGFDISTAKPVAGAPEGESAEASFLSKFPLSGTAEAVANLATGAIAKPVSDIAGLAAIPLHAAGVIDKDPAAVKHAIESGGTYEPKTKSGKLQAEYNPIALAGKVLQFGSGAVRKAIEPASSAAGVIPEIQRGAARGTEELIMQAPAFFGARGTKAKPAETTIPKREPGAAAEKAVNELQAQSEAVGPGGKVRDLPLQSAHEMGLVELDKVTKPMRDAAFKEGRPVDMTPTLELIEQMKTQTTNPNVLQSLDDAAAIIKDGVQKSGGGVETVQTAAGPMMVKNGKLVPAEASNSISIQLLDESRQAINEILQGKGEKLHGKFAQKELLAAQREMLKGAPPSYQKYLSEYVKLAGGLDKFTAEGSAINKVASAPEAFPAMSRGDKQARIETVFKDKEPGRALTELVRDTAHNPEAATGLRGAYLDWLTEADPTIRAPRTGSLLKRWNDTKDAVRSSGLMTPEHVAQIDKIMGDVFKDSQGTGVGRTVARVGGFLAGSKTGHPVVAATAAGTLFGAVVKKKTAANLERAVMEIAGNPQAAAAMAAPNTPANVAALRSILPADVATMLITPAAQMEQQEGRPKPRPVEKLISPQSSIPPISPDKQFKTFNTLPFRRG